MGWVPHSLLTDFPFATSPSPSSLRPDFRSLYSSLKLIISPMFSFLFFLEWHAPSSIIYSSHTSNFFCNDFFPLCLKLEFLIQKSFPFPVISFATVLHFFSLRLLKGGYTLSVFPSLSPYYFQFTVTVMALSPDTLCCFCGQGTPVASQR